MRVMLACVFAVLASGGCGRSHAAYLCDGESEPRLILQDLAATGGVPAIGFANGEFLLLDGQCRAFVNDGDEPFVLRTVLLPARELDGLANELELELWSTERTLSYFRDHLGRSPCFGVDCGNPAPEDVFERSRLLRQALYARGDRVDRGGLRVLARPWVTGEGPRLQWPEGLVPLAEIVVAESSDGPPCVDCVLLSDAESDVLRFELRTHAAASGGPTRGYFIAEDRGEQYTILVRDTVPYEDEDGVLGWP